METILSRDEYRLLVAQVADRVIGLVGAYLALALEFDGRYGRLIGLVVDVNARGQGIGRMLMD